MRPAQLDKMLTEARGVMAWLREGSLGAAAQTVRVFATYRAKAIKDIKARLPMRQRACMPRDQAEAGRAAHAELHDARLPA